MLGFDRIVYLDFETTGLNPANDYPIEVAVKVVDYNGMVEVGGYDYSTLIKLPKGVKVPKFITELTGLTTEQVQLKGKMIKQVAKDIGSSITRNSLVIAHNANFDLGYLFHHLDIQPRYFYCTRTAEILYNPHLNASLKNVFGRYFGETEQAHRAMDDIDMMKRVFEKQIEINGLHGSMYFINKVVNMPDREIVFIPVHSKVLDFTDKYVSIKEYNKLKDELNMSVEEVGRLREFSNGDYDL